MKIFFIALLMTVASARTIFDDINEMEMHPDPARDNQRAFDTINVLEETNYFWNDLAYQNIQTKLRNQFNLGTAKNIILFLGDGMSIPTLAATRVYLGGEERKLSFEDFPYSGLSKTYCVNSQVADSACSATAYLTGVKGNILTAGVNAKVPYAHCTAALDPKKQTHSIAKWAMDAGKDAGFVTTTTVTHASPSAIYAHIADRNWENNKAVRDSGCNDTLTDDIAEQLMLGPTGSRLKVILGGGRGHFMDQSLPDPESMEPGFRTDGKNLIKEWREKNDGEVRRYVWKKSDLLKVNAKRTDRLLGLFDRSHCPMNLERVREGLNEEPTLTEMFDKASDVLMKNEKGFFLFVEGGRIDHGHHFTTAKFALDETAEFSKAVDLARRKFSQSDTLIVVTSDHGHTMSISGYPKRNNDIFGNARISSKDGLPYMTISYANGPGYYTHTKDEGGRYDPDLIDKSKDSFTFPATVPLSLETHGGEDVGIFASGPYAHLFSGTMEQNMIPHLMAYAACIGDGLKSCKGILQP